MVASSHEQRLYVVTIKLAFVAQVLLTVQIKWSEKFSNDIFGIIPSTV